MRRPTRSTAILEEASQVRHRGARSAQCDRAIAKASKLLPDGTVKTPAGFKAAYRQFAENGWNGLTKPAEYGGQGLPQLVADAGRGDVACGEHGVRPVPAADAGRDRGDRACAARPSRRRRYLPKMVSGDWTGTMNLTEPQAGSDLAAVRTRAVPQGDGSYKLFGQKIFITLRRARLHRQHRPPRARAHARRARRRQGHFAVPRAEVPGQRRRLARRAQRRALRVARAQARHPREPDGGARVRRPRRRDRLPGRRGEPRPRVHVHHDEPGALLGRHGGRRAVASARTSARSRMRASACRAGRPGATRRPRRRRSSITPTSAAC